MSFPPPTDGQARVLWMSVTALAVGLLMALLCLLLWGLGRVLEALSPVLWPLAVAGVIAYLLDPVVDFLEAHRVPRTRAILLVFGVAVFSFLGVAGSVVPQVVVESRQLVNRIPGYTLKVRDKVERWMEKPPSPLRRFLPWAGGLTNAIPPESLTNATIFGDATNAAISGRPAGTTPVDVVATSVAPGRAVGPAGRPHEPQANRPVGASTEAPGTSWGQALASDALHSVTVGLSRVLPAIGAWLFGQVTKVASWFGVLAGLFLIPVYAFYFLLEKRGIQSRWPDYLPVVDSAFKDELVFVLQSINDYLISFFRGQVLVAICDGILYTLGFLLIGLPYAVLIGVIATFLTIIPYVGAIVTCVLALIVAVVQFGDILHPILVLAVFAVVQSLEGFLIAPKILGDRVGLHPLTIIIAVVAGTTLLGGVLGGILAIPFTAALRVLMFRYVWRKPDAKAAPATSTEVR